MFRPCSYCKSARHVGDSCPLHARALSFAAARRASFAEHLAGPAPSPFVGRFGYPSVRVGLLTAPTGVVRADELDCPKEWVRKGHSIAAIAGLRCSMVNSHITLPIGEPERVLGVVQEAAMANRPVEVEVSLARRPVFVFQTDAQHAPLGPSAELKSALLTANSHISRRVQRVVDDTDLSAKQAVVGLFEKGVDENSLTRMLSTGLLGIGALRRLVPTRWAITATDSTVGDALLSDVRELQIGYSYDAFYGTLHGNYYLFLMIPGKWQFELFEIYVPTGAVTTDSEPFTGRSSYAEQCVGGYYTARLAAAEYLRGKKRQFAVLALRFITDEYTIPLGVWVTREASRKAFSRAPIQFSSQELLFTYAKAFARNNFGYVLDGLLQRSYLIGRCQQRTLDVFA